LLRWRASLDAEVPLRQTLTSPQSSAFEAQTSPPAASAGEILKLEANLAEVLLGRVMLEGSDDFLQRKTAADPASNDSPLSPGSFPPDLLCCQRRAR
jgi:hypothetical protein